MGHHDGSRPVYLVIARRQCHPEISPMKLLPVGCIQDGPLDALKDRQESVCVMGLS